MSAPFTFALSSHCSLVSNDYTHGDESWQWSQSASVTPPVLNNWFLESLYVTLLWPLMTAFDEVLCEKYLWTVTVDDKDVTKAVEPICVQTRRGCRRVFDLWSRGHVSSVWIQLGWQEADKVSVVSRATGSDQLWALRAVWELCLYLFPAADSICLNSVVYNLLWLGSSGASCWWKLSFVDLGLSIGCN